MRISDWSSDVCSSDLLTRTGEVLSRLTTDTTLLQTVVGSSVSIAIRNFLLLIGGTVLLVITSAKLTALVFLVVPMVLLPILTYGRRVRRLSRASQDRVADLGVYAGEALRSEEHTSELQSLMRPSYAVCCLTKKNH